MSDFAGKKRLTATATDRNSHHDDLFILLNRQNCNINSAVEQFDEVKID